MGDSDDDYDRKRRDKFRGERADAPPYRGGGGGAMGGGGGGPNRSAMRDDWSERESAWPRPPRPRDYRSGAMGRDRGYSPGMDAAPPAKRIRHDFYGAGDGYYNHHYAAAAYHQPPPHRPGNFYREAPAVGGGVGGGFGLAGGGGGNNAVGHHGEGQQSPMMSFKAFLATQDDNISDSDAIEKYNDYKLEFQRQQLNEFFVSHKDEEWFRVRYHPEDSQKRKEEQLANLKKRVEVFMDLLKSNKLSQVSVDYNHTNDLLKLMDTVVIKLEGGTEEDLQCLETEYDENEKQKTTEFSIEIVTQNDKVAPTKCRSENGENAFDGEEGEIEDQPLFKVKATKSGNESTTNQGEEDAVWYPEETDEKLRTLNFAEKNVVVKSPSQEEEHKEVDEETAADEKPDKTEEMEGVEEEKVVAPPVSITKEAVSTKATGKKRKRSASVDSNKSSSNNSSSSSSSSSTNSDDSSEEEDENVGGKPKKSAKNKAKTNGEDQDDKNKPEEEEEGEEENESKEEGMKIKVETAAPVPALAPPTTIVVEEEEEVAPPQKKPRMLHKTTSIFLRNLSPTITKQEVEAVCGRYDGFLRVALAEPQPERRWMRRAWVTFKRDANIKEIAWNLNSIRLRDCELGAIVNRDLSRRMRTVNGLTAHKPIVRSDIRVAARVVLHLDQKYDLWTDLEHQQKTQNAPPQTSGSFLSKNPVLHNITDYLIEEASAEEDELLGLGDTMEQQETVSTVERDDTLISVLDRIIFYLRIVHSVDYYNHCEYPNEDEMPNRCGIIHARGPPPISKTDMTSFLAPAIEAKMTNFLPEKASTGSGATSKTNATNKNEKKLLHISLKDTDTEIDNFVKANTRELAKDKWLCPLSGKKFKGPDFVRKHIFNKHGEKIEEVKKEVEFFNNYLRDAKRPMLATETNSGAGGGGGGGGGGIGFKPMREESHVPTQQPPSYNHPRFGGGGYGNYGRMPMYFNQGGGSGYGHRTRGYAPRSRGGGIGGGGGGGPHDFRPIIHYRDLDAPREAEEFI